MRIGLDLGLGVGGGAFIPTRIAGCTVWLPSQASSMAADGSSWTNGVPAGAPFTAAGADRPTYVASGINGRPSFRFDGLAHKMAGPVASTIIGASSAYVFMAFKINGITINDATVYNNDSLFSDNGADFGAALRGTSNVLRSYNYAGGYAEPTALSIAVGSTYVLTWKHTGGNVSHQVNNGTPQSAASGATSDLTSALQIASCQGFRYASIDLAEVVMFNAALSAADESRVRTWMMGRAGL